MSLPFSCIILWPHCWTACRERAISSVAEHLHIFWLGYHNVTEILLIIFGESHISSVFRGDLNFEQYRELFHAAHEILFAIIDQLHMRHTTVCQNVKISKQLQKNG